MRLLAAVVDPSDNLLGGMWAVVATVFVFRDARDQSVSAGLARHDASGGDSDHPVHLRWTKEKPGQIKCTGACAKVWPPLLLRAGTSVPKRVSGVSGTFGLVVRPDKTRQLTYDGHALYTYSSDTKPGEALCQGVEGWYVLPIH